MSLVAYHEEIIFELEKGHLRTLIKMSLIDILRCNHP